MASKFSIRRFVICRVQVNTSVKDGTMNIGNHRSYITCSVWVCGVFEVFNYITDWFIPVDFITLVTRIYSFASILRENHVWSGKHELSNGRIKTESVNVTSLEGKYKLYGRTVCYVTCAYTFSSRAK